MKRSKDQLRIAVIGHKRIPSREGGIEIVVAELTTRMAAMGHVVTCYNRRGHHVSGADFDAEKQKEYQGVKLKTVFTLQKKGLAALTSSVAASIRVAFGRYDVVHYHAEGPCGMLWLPKLFGKRCIATIHGLDHKRAKWGRFASWYIRFGEKCAVKYADEIIVLSENVQTYFAETYGRETVYIPNGITRPVEGDGAEILSRFGIEDDDYILYLGRLVPEKGLIYLVEAFKRVDTDKKLVIAGGQSDTPQYAEELTQLAADDPRIIFTDFVEGETLIALYRGAYLYVLPSILEGMPMSLLEAMSYGNCCLTSDIPECVNVIGNCGCTFKCGDSLDLKNKLQKLCNDREYVAYFKARSADFVCRKFNWDDVTAQTLKLYGVAEESLYTEEEKIESPVG